MKIFLRLGKNPHSAYECLLKQKIVLYILNQNSVSKHVIKNRFFLSIKRMAWSLFSSMTLVPRISFYKNECDLIHSTNNILLRTKNNWVTDTEYVGGLFGFNYSFLNLKQNLLKNIFQEPNFKGLICWSEAAKKSVVNFVGEDLTKNKIFLLKPIFYPSFNPNPKKKLRKILFIGNLFYEKGGREIINAFIKVRKKYPSLSLTIVSNVPNEYQSVLGVNYIAPYLSRLKIEQLYKTHDLLVFPTFMDTYGMVLCEAKSYGLPVITTNCFACPEIIKDGVNGFVLKTNTVWYTNNYLFNYNKFKNWESFVDFCTSKVNKDLEEMICAKIELLVRNDKLINKMSKQSIKDSVVERKEFGQALNDIYTRCVE